MTSNDANLTLMVMLMLCLDCCSVSQSQSQTRWTFSTSRIVKCLPASEDKHFRTVCLVWMFIVEEENDKSTVTQSKAATASPCRNCEYKENSHKLSLVAKHGQAD